MGWQLWSRWFSRLSVRRAETCWCLKLDGKYRGLFPQKWKSLVELRAGRWFRCSQSPTRRWSTRIVGSSSGSGSRWRKFPVSGSAALSCQFLRSWSLSPRTSQSSAADSGICATIVNILIVLQAFLNLQTSVKD